MSCYTVVLAMSGNCTVSGLHNRGVSAIEGAVCHSGVSVKRGSTIRTMTLK